MSDVSVRWVPVSEVSGMLYFGDVIDVGLVPLIGAVSREIGVVFPEVCEVTPSYTSILVEVGCFSKSLEELGVGLLELVDRVRAEGVGAGEGRLIELPVYYDVEVGVDLEAVAEYAGMGVEDVVEVHSGREYAVCAIGFAPGFAFLAEVDERIAMPRRGSPRSHVPAGSVGIAGRQTAVYPADTPGGWQLIGKCPEVLYDAERVPPSPFEVGDRVRFLPIGRADFLERGGCV